MTRRPHFSWACLALMLVAATLVMYLEARGMTFRRDDWNMILTRRGGSPEVFLRPHNGHLLALHALAYKGLLEIFGMRSYAPFQLLALGLHALVVTLLFVYARRRVGPIAALAVAALFAVPGTAAHDVLWTFQIGFLGAVASGIAMLLALDRRDLRGDLMASALLVISLLWSGVGIFVALAATVEFGVSRRGWRVAARVLAVPFALFALWGLTYGGSVPPELVPATELDVEQPLLDNLLAAPGYVINAAGGAIGNGLGFPPEFWPALGLVGVGLVAARILLGGQIRPRAWTILALPLAYWSSLAVARGQFNDFAQPHYLYPGVAFTLLAAVELLREVRPSRRAQAVAALALVAVVMSNLGTFRLQTRGLVFDSSDVLARLTALEAARGKVDEDFRPAPNPFGSSPDIVAGSYFAAIDDWGSPAPSPEELALLPDQVRAVADETLLRALGVRLLPRAGLQLPGPRPEVDRVTAGRVLSARGCTTLVPATAPGSVEVGVPEGGVSVTAAVGGPVNLYVRRFSSSFRPPAFASLPSTAARVIRFPADRLGEPQWHLKVEATQRVRICGLSP